MSLKVPFDLSGILGAAVTVTSQRHLLSCKVENILFNQGPVTQSWLTPRSHFSKIPFQCTASECPRGKKTPNISTSQETKHRRQSKNN